MATSKIELSAATPTPVNQLSALITALRVEGDLDQLKEFKITPELFEQIRQGLNATIDSMEKNPSFISRMAKSWGDLPTWQKIVGGIVLTAPTLIIGIVAHIGFLLAICGVTAVMYAGGSIILDDHHNCTPDNVIQSLKDGVFGLTQFLELTITALDIIRQKLGAEVDKFAQDNIRLNNSINVLDDKLSALDREITAAVAMTAALSETKDGLQQTADTLGEQVTAQSNLLAANQRKIAQIIQAFTAQKAELDEKIAAFGKERDALAAEITSLRQIGSSLQILTQNLSGVYIADEEQRLAFKEKFDAFLSDEKTSFAQFAASFSQIAQKLAALEVKYAQDLQRFEGLLDKQEGQIARLEEVPIPNQTKGTLASDIGFFAPPPAYNVNPLEPDPLPQLQQEGQNVNQSVN